MSFTSATVVAPLLCIVTMIGIMAAFGVPAYQMYKERAAAAQASQGLDALSWPGATSTSALARSLVFVLLTPLSHWAWFVAYVGSSIVRGLAVGLGVFVVTLAFARPEFAAPLWILVFALLGAALLATLGLIAGLWADKFDQMA
eukprot:gene34771-42885_t